MTTRTPNSPSSPPDAPRLDLARFDPMRTRSDDQAVRDGYVWLPEKAERVTRFVEKYCRLWEDRWAGQPIRLMDYQQDFLWRLYGWVHGDTGSRRFWEAYWEVAKKNGKSPLIAALAIYHLVADGVNAPQVHLNASSQGQAGVVYRSAAMMVAQDRRLMKMIRETPSDFRLEYPAKNGYIVANSVEAGTKDGFNPSFTIFDELHRQKGRELWDVYQHGGIARLDPLIVSITTAGVPDNEHPCYIQHRRALAVEDGSRVDVNFLGVVHGPREPNPDVDDRRVWRMANPALGVITSEQKFAADLRKAKDEGPAALLNFKRLRLNIWSKEVAKWLDMRAWNAQPAGRTDEEIAESGDVWAAGLDMSTNVDLTAYVRVAGNIRSGVDVRAMFWIPEETAIRRSREERLPYLEWAERGLVRLIPGPVIKAPPIAEYIREDAARLKGKLRRVLSDFHNAGEVGEICLAGGVDFQWFVPRPVNFHAPLTIFENLVLLMLLRHGGNPVLDMCAGCAVLSRVGAVQNKILTKAVKTDRIDGVVALSIGLAGLVDLIGYSGEGGELGRQPKYDENPRITWVKF